MHPAAHHTAATRGHRPVTALAVRVAMLMAGLLVLTACGGGDEPEDIPKPSRGSLILQAPPAQAQAPTVGR